MIILTVKSLCYLICIMIIAECWSISTYVTALHCNVKCDDIIMTMVIIIISTVIGYCVQIMFIII